MTGTVNHTQKPMDRSMCPTRATKGATDGCVVSVVSVVSNSIRGYTPSPSASSALLCTTNQGHHYHQRMMGKRRIISCHSLRLVLLHLLVIVLNVGGHALPSTNDTGRSPPHSSWPSQRWASTTPTPLDSVRRSHDDTTVPHHVGCGAHWRTRLSRRSLGRTCGATAASLLLPSLDLPSGAHAAQVTTTRSSSPPTSIRPEDALVTDKVFMNVRISRQDGTFYVRDDLQDIPENRVFSGRLVLGLFGTLAPTHVERFLSYVNTGTNLLDDNPMPSYSRAVFPTFDQATGLLTGGRIPALEYTEISGRPALRYGDRLLPSTLWVEKRNANEPPLPRISHTAKGLLTHRQLEVLPVFGITTRSDTTELDSSHTVFGQILSDESSTEFLKIVQDLPTYAVERPTSMKINGGSTDPGKENVVQDAAQAVFNAQRGFFRGAAKSLGDTRVSKVYEGKLLRRVEVTQVGIL